MGLRPLPPRIWSVANCNSFFLLPTTQGVWPNGRPINAETDIDLDQASMKE
ncbi:hypothetical protein SAMN05216202_5495 [Pseudomonas mucidolens]|uniref:Uncharacterized protein n=1 Tax=Pseudomonas mucidolens TaxID=46679 RepID=A0A1H2P412_9PSED|nr:hypothetical protein SAMN05216202_5495 [Pseudomonas mucidolens]SQH36226.1 Uncharacterised protein [Pseudomonas mucidolens]